MKKNELEEILKYTIHRHPDLGINRDSVWTAFEMLRQCYESGHKLLVCGNGGSAADADHIVGELMKSFSVRRRLAQESKNKIIAVSPELGPFISENLEPALSTISLTCHTALNTAISNDMDAQLIFAQQVLGYGREGDVLLGISTSGNSKNVINAMITAKSIGVGTIGLTGEDGGDMKEFCDVMIGVAGNSVAEIQELHLPVYHCLCSMLELHFFDT